MYKFFLKRSLDFFSSSFLLLLLLPVFVFVGVLIKITSKGPIFFLQERLGKKGTRFMVYKFRTMTNTVRQVNREILSGDPDVTLLGKFLRRFKIDELPQLINVFLGNMSFVGPRPCMPSLMDEFNDDGFYRLKVIPGLTGLAQVNGNIHLTWPERWKYDREYVERLSFLLDGQIVLKTMIIVLFGEEKFIKKPNV